MTATTWNVDPAHTDIQFSAKHMMVTTVRGKFSGVSGTLTMDEDRPAASGGSFSVAAASLNTGVEQRDGHLRSADFFDVERYPEITFESTRLEPAGSRRFRLVGDLTIHGVTRPVTLDVEATGRTKDPWGNERAGFSAKTTIDRKDFGLTWNQVLEAGGVAVGDKITIELEIEAVKQAAARQVA